MWENALEMLTSVCVLISMLFVMAYEIIPVINKDKLKFRNSHSKTRKLFLFYREGKKILVCNSEMQ